MKLRNLTLALGLIGGLTLVGQAQAIFMIDDFNTATSYIVSDNTGGGANSLTPITAGNVVMNAAGGGTWNRRIAATRTTGANPDEVETQVCSTCLAGHLVSDPGTAGDGYWIYTGGGPVDLSTYTGLMFDYAADLDGAVVEVKFNDGGNTSEVTSAPLSNTNNSSNITIPANRIPVLLSLSSATGSVNWAAITGVQIGVLGNSVVGLDFSIDQVKLVPEPAPEPASLALLGLGLAGLRWQRRRFGTESTHWRTGSGGKT